MAVAVGGYNANFSLNSSIEVYSPNGKCNNNLLNNDFLEPNLRVAIIANSFIFCRTGTLCNKYNFYSSNWEQFPTSQYPHYATPAKVYQNKLYLAENFNPEIFDPESGSWSNWEKPLNQTGTHACSAIWRDTLLVFGGIISNYSFEKYNFTRKSWTNLKYSPTPYDWPSCLVLPADQNKLLVTGSGGLVVSIYDLVKEEWESAGTIKTLKVAGDLVALGKRVFFMGGRNATSDTDKVEEFHLANKSWTIVDQKMGMAKRHFRAISIPAFLYQNEIENCTGVN